MRQENLIGICFGFFLVSLTGCVWQETHQPVMAREVPAANLLRTSMNSFDPNLKRGVQKSSRVQLDAIAKMHIQFKAGGKTRRFQLFQDNDKWWVVLMTSEEASVTRHFPTREVTRIMKSLINLKPAPKLELNPEEAEVQLSLFSQDGRFLLRALRTPNDKKVGALYHGEWLVYHQGNLLKQGRKGRIYRAFRLLRRRLLHLERGGGWLRLPLNSMNLNHRVARGLGTQLKELRSSLKRCFKKYSFPSNIGSMRMLLHFGSDGKLSKKPKIETSKHAKHKALWCVWYHVKKWEIKSTPEVPFFHGFRYRLILGAHGP